MKKKKLNLEDLELESLVTSLGDTDLDAIAGGTNVEAAQQTGLECFSKESTTLCECPLTPIPTTPLKELHERKSEAGFCGTWEYWTRCKNSGIEGCPECTG